MSEHLRVAAELDDAVCDARDRMISMATAPHKTSWKRVRQALLRMAGRLEHAHMSAMGAPPDADTPLCVLGPGGEYTIHIHEEDI